MRRGGGDYLDAVKRNCIDRVLVSGSQWSQLMPSVPVKLRGLVSTCVRKESKGREEEGTEDALSISRAWILNEMVWYGSAAICARRFRSNKPSQPLPCGDMAGGEEARARTHEEVLPVAIGRLDFLLKRRHEAVSRADAVLDFGVVHLEEEAELARHWIPHFGHLRGVRERRPRASVRSLCL